MKFRIGTNHDLIAERKDLQPAFVKGALAAHEGKPEENPYHHRHFRHAWELGYQGVKQGKVIVDESADPDEGLEIRPEIIDRLNKSRALPKESLVSLEEMRRRGAQ